MLRLLLFVLPLGIDTLGVSIGLGIKSHRAASTGKTSTWVFPSWLGSALLFSLAETFMPLVGLAIGSAVSLLISNVMHLLGPLLLIGIGLWELLEEIRERIGKHNKLQNQVSDDENVVAGLAPARSMPDRSNSTRSIRWDRQLLLVLSISLDELAIGFSLGAITSDLPGNKTVSTITLCILIGLQGLLMAVIGLTLGRIFGALLKFVKDWTEFLSCFLLITLGIWLLLT
jgi:putative Mn2+ efflux pump MntP